MSGPFNLYIAFAGSSGFSLASKRKIYLSEKRKVIGQTTARGDTRFVICVYTYDYQDEEDVMRVRQVLKDLGIQREIIYKADADTRAGSYGADYTPKYRA